MKKSCRKNDIENDKYLKGHHKAILIEKVCTSCSEFDCKENRHRNYWYYLRYYSRQNSKSNTFINYLKHMKRNTVDLREEFLLSLYNKQQDSKCLYNTQSINSNCNLDINKLDSYWRYLNKQIRVGKLLD